MRRMKQQNWRHAMASNNVAGKFPLRQEKHKQAEAKKCLVVASTSGTSKLKTPDA